MPVTFPLALRSICGPAATPGSGQQEVARHDVTLQLLQSVERD